MTQTSSSRRKRFLVEVTFRTCQTADQMIWIRTGFRSGIRLIRVEYIISCLVETRIQRRIFKVIEMDGNKDVGFYYHGSEAFGRRLNMLLWQWVSYKWFFLACFVRNSKTANGVNGIWTEIRSQFRNRIRKRGSWWRQSLLALLFFATRKRTLLSIGADVAAVASPLPCD